jgi:hypothetical protein
MNFHDINIKYTMKLTQGCFSFLQALTDTERSCQLDWRSLLLPLPEKLQEFLWWLYKKLPKIWLK